MFERVLQEPLQIAYCYFSSNIYEVIKSILNFFLRKDFAHTKSTKKKPKSSKRTQGIKGTNGTKSTIRTKKHKKHKNITKQKHKNVNKQTKIKNALKNYLREKSHLFAYLRFCASKEKN